MTVQNVIIFTLGATAGAAVASLVLKDKYDKKYKALYSDELDSYRESFERMRKMDKDGVLVQNSQYMGVVDEKKVEAKADSVITGAERKLMGYASIYSRDKDSQRMKDEVKRVKEAENYIAESESPSEDECETYEETQMRKVNEGKAKREEPKLIRADEYDNEYLYHDKVSLLYYTEDDMLVEEVSNIPVDDIAAAVGDCLDKYGFRKNDEQVIYVRNVNIGADFEITKINAAFGDEGGNLYYGV